MDYSKFFTYYDFNVDYFSNRTDKVGILTLVATKKNFFYKEGQKVSIGIYHNHLRGKMFQIPPVRDFVTYFGALDDFSEFLFDLWEKNKPSTYRYE